VTAGSQTAELLDGLHVDTGRMAAVVYRPMKVAGLKAKAKPAPTP